MQNPYSKPAIKRFPGKWFVEYYYDVPPELLQFYKGTRKRVKVYEGINRVSDEERETYAQDLRDAVEIALAAGYTPFGAELEEQARRLEEEAKAAAEAQAQEEKGQPILELLELYLKQKKKDGLEDRSLEGYRTAVNHFRDYLESKGLEGIQVSDVTEDLIIDYLDKKTIEKSWRNRTYNTQREACFMWFNWLVLHRYIKENPLTKRVSYKQNNSTKNEYYSGRVREAIKSELAKDPVIRRLCEATYYTCCRNYEELCHLQIKHVDRENQVIFVPEDIGKTGARYVPISQELDKLLFDEMKIADYPLDFYIFSVNAVPGPKPVSKNYYSRRYAMIKEKLGLGTEYTIYSWKHTRVIDLLKEGFTDAEVMDLTGHTDTGSYDHYKRGLGGALNNRIKGKTLAF